MRAQVLGSLTLMSETQIKFLASGTSMAHLWRLWAFGQRISGQKNYSSFSSFQKNKLLESVEFPIKLEELSFP